jgi:hypothetical protein
MIYHSEAAILCRQSAAAIEAFSGTSDRVGVCSDCGVCLVPSQSFEGPQRMCHSRVCAAPKSNRPWNLSVLGTQDVFGTSGACSERLTTSRAASEAEGEAAMGHRPEIVNRPADHRPTEWERHDAR